MPYLGVACPEPHYHQVWKVYKEKGKTSSAEWPLDVRKTTAAGCSALPVLTGKCKVILSIRPGRKPLHSAN